MPPSSHQRPQPAAPPVRVEVRHGGAPPVGFDVTGDEFVVGSLPGCDLRLPGANLPAQVCIIRRTPDGVRLKKVAPALPILLNGSPLSPAGQATLRHGDVVSVGPIDLHISIDFRLPEASPSPISVSEPGKVAGDRRQEDWDQRYRELEERARALEEQGRELDADRVLWYERRAEIEKEILSAREEAAARDESPALVSSLRTRVEQEVAEDFRARREELERMQLSVREAAVQLREKKQQFEDSLKNVDPRWKELTVREKALAVREREVETQAAEWKRQRDAFEADRQVSDLRFQQREQDLARREVELAARELAARQMAEAAERDRSQYQSDLMRVDRMSAALEVKERALADRAAEIDRRDEQFKKDTHDFEEQLQLFDDREERAKDEEARLAARHEELDARDAKLNQRLAEIETQQTVLVTLRTRLEHLRDDLRAQESRIAASRERTDEEARQAEDRLRRAEVVREEVESEKTGHAESARLYQERSELMAQAAERLRTMQEQLVAESDRLKNLEEALQVRATEQAEQAGLIKARAEQLLEAQQRVEADRRALRERDAALRQSEEAREMLQEQLRQRSEELASRQRDADERARQLSTRAQELADQIEQIEALRADAASARRLTEEEAAILAHRDEKLQAAERMIADQKQQLEAAESRFEQEQLDAEDRLTRARTEIEELKAALSARTDELLGQMPDLEQRAQAAIDRTAQAREAMRAQLAELHAYAIRSQDDLQAVRAQVQDELNRLRDQDQALNRARSEHRLAVSSFRQQLIEWQNRFAGMKQALHQGETRLDRREKQVEATAQHLVERAEQIEQAELEVTEKRTEVDRHLGDMRAWYRQKFREIAETRWSQYGGRGAGSDERGVGESGILSLPPRSTAEITPTAARPPAHSESILPLPDDLEPGDRNLGELLRTLDIIDRDTLLGLWDDARRQRRTLRQVLLAGGFLTLYQLALIESGNLNGLMLGRFRVVDRLLSTPRESIYRVFDPQTRSADEGTCLLRHLGEAEALDAVRPDEYRQRFGAARDLAHPNVAATLEVLEIGGRPAAVQEWLTGLAGSDWPAATSSPGVWHRLLMQAALGLHAAHSVGLIHGRLTGSSFLLTPSGVVKLIGVGEPPWLHPGASDHEPNVEDDLRTLGRVALNWMQAGSRRKGTKPKPIPPALQEILSGLGAAASESNVPLALYPSTATLIEDLDRISRQLPADQGTWEKLLAFAQENAGDGVVLRQSA